MGGPRSWGAALGDVDGDGDFDAFVIDFFGLPNMVWMKDGTGTYLDSGQRP